MKKILELMMFVGVWCVSFGASSSIAIKGREGVFVCTPRHRKPGS
jgi:hypothetical protein